MSPVRILVGYLHPWPNDTGILLASAHGLFAREGLDVEILAADPLRGDALGAVQAGEADLAVCPSNRLLARRARGERLVGVAALNHRGLESVQTTTGTGIARPRDLQGRRVAYNPTPRGIAMLRRIVSRDGGDPDLIVTVDSALRELSVDDIAAGEVDATFGGYWAWDALFADLDPGQRVMWPADQLADLRYHSYLLAAREESVAEQAPLIRSLLAAIGEGYETAAGEHGAALEVLERVIPYFPRPVLARSLALIAPTWTHEGRWGRQREELIEPYSQWLSQSGAIEAPVDGREAVTNELLPR